MQSYSMFIMGLRGYNFNMNIKIPEISDQVYKEDILGVMENKYSTLGSVWVIIKWNGVMEFILLLKIMINF